MPRSDRRRWWATSSYETCNCGGTSRRSFLRGARLPLGYLLRNLFNWLARYNANKAITRQSGLPMSRATYGLDETIRAYLLANQPPEHPLLAELRDVTATMTRSRMQISPEQGHFLAFLIRLVGARRVLEVGTFTGYSSLCMALALPAEGRVVACDNSEEWTNIARQFWKKAGLADKVELRLGPAVDTLNGLIKE